MSESGQLQQLVPMCLASLRRRRHLSQQELGERMGVGRRRVAYIEGAKNLTLRTTDRYLEALGYTTRELIALISHELSLAEVLGEAGPGAGSGTGGAGLSRNEAERLETAAEQVKDRLQQRRQVDSSAAADPTKNVG